MHPLVRGAAAAAVLTALGSFDRPVPPPPVPPPERGAAPSALPRGVDGLPAPCLPGTLPEGPVCVRIPASDAAKPSLTAPTPEPVARSGVDASRIARRPDRPADPAAYLYPVGGTDRAPRILGGGGLQRTVAPAASDLPGLHLAARPGEKVILLTLDRQDGSAEVVHVGDLFGVTVVTRHRVDEAGKKRDYLLFHGRLDRAEPGLSVGSKLEGGATLGFARADNGGGLIEIYIEARVLREGATLDPKKLTDASIALPIDARDVLPLRAR
jgi:hypothetical protein